MCGIAGYIGKKKISKKVIEATLKLMKNRGPDNQNCKLYKVFDLNFYMLHSRLNIIDINKRSNQPYIYKDYAIIFNGEIYNYLEIKKELEEKSIKFNTNSDTEVLLKAYLFYGLKFFQKLEGMWSFVILNKKKQQVLISRDRFGEKPLFYKMNKKELYFGSEIKFIKSLTNQKLKIDEDLLFNYLFLGYKSIKKNYDTFFKKIKEFPKSSYLILDKNYKLNIKRYWNLKYRPRKTTFKIAIKKIKKLLLNSVRMRIRSDVPIAFSLSGGVDSNILAGITKKKLKKKIECFSIIDKDHRYNEQKNVKLSKKFLDCRVKTISPPIVNNISNLEKLIEYHDSPISTINFLVHSYLTKKVSKDKFKVLISGVGADEIFSGYYDHTLQYLYEIRNLDNFKKEFEYWKKKICIHIRNSTFKDGKLYFNNKKFRNHLYDLNQNKLSLSKDKKKLDNKKFYEKNFTKSLMRKRMLNELFYESVPVILKEEDLNCMNNSIENRAPYLDRKLIEYLYTIPTKMLIKNGFTKFLLRKAGRDFAHKNILSDTKKIGFNYSINSIINLKSKEFNNKFLNKKNKIFKFINYKKFKLLLSQNKLQNDEKFLFNFINASIFLKRFS